MPSDSCMHIIISYSIQRQFCSIQYLGFIGPDPPLLTTEKFNSEIKLAWGILVRSQQHATEDSKMWVLSFSKSGFTLFLDRKVVWFCANLIYMKTGKKAANITRYLPFLPHVVFFPTILSMRFYSLQCISASSEHTDCCSCYLLWPNPSQILTG